MVYSDYDVFRYLFIAIWQTGYQAYEKAGQTPRRGVFGPLAASMREA
jgi:hypothetical protein